MTKFHNVCARAENPKTQKVSWPQIGTIIQTDEGKMYFKLNTSPNELFHCFLNEPKNEQGQTQQPAQQPAQAPQNTEQAPF